MKLHFELLFYNFFNFFLLNFNLMFGYSHRGGRKISKRRFKKSRGIKQYFLIDELITYSDIICKAAKIKLYYFYNVFLKIESKKFQ